MVTFLRFRRPRRRIRVLALGTFVALLMMGALAEHVCSCSTREKAFVAAMKSDLRYLVVAQDRYRETHGRYAATLGELTPDLYSSSTHVVVELRSWSAAGFSAVARHAAVPRDCVIFVGDVRKPHRDALEGTPHCEE